MLARVSHLKRAPALALALLGTACGGTEPGPASDGSAERGRAEFEALRDRYGMLETLAGSGLRGGDDTNDWDPSYEGGPATSADLSTPHNALGDAAGNTFIADKDAHAIRKVTPEGTIVTVAGVNEPGDDGDGPLSGTSAHLYQPNGLWVRADGTVYILDLGNRKIRKLDTNGELRTLFGVPSLGTGRGLWVADDERLAYVCSGGVVKRWSAEGGLEDYASGFHELGNLAVVDGHVFVTDRGAHRVFELPPEGAPKPIAGNGLVAPLVDGARALETSLNGVRGIFPSDAGGLFLATHEGSKVLYLDSEGFVHIFIDGARGAHSGDGEPVSTPGYKVSEVRSVTVNPHGDVLVTENDLGYVRVTRRVR
jgi:sugar lactone lactonase YvrE